MEFVRKFAGDLGAAAAAGTVVIGALAADVPATGPQLAARPGTDARCVSVWLAGAARRNHQLAEIELSPLGDGDVTMPLIVDLGRDGRRSSSARRRAGGAIGAAANAAESIAK